MKIRLYYFLVLSCVTVLGTITGCKKGEEPGYTVIFDTKGGNPTPEPQTVKKGGKVERPSDPTFPDQHYRFSGWSKADNATSALWNFDEETVTEDMTLYARWDVDKYAIFFDSDGGSPVNVQYVAHGDVIVKPEDPKYNGHLFDVWCRDDKEWDFNTPVTVPITLKARWTALTTFYVDVSDGDDNHPGTKSLPWKTLNNISSTVFKSGDSILLKRGDFHLGSVTLRGVGTAAKPITLTSYGSGNRPHIKGVNINRNSYCVQISDDSEGWRIKGIELEDGFTGILVWIKAGAGNDYYHIEDCYIHDNNNRVTPLPFGHAIRVRGAATGLNTASNITVKNCIFDRNDREFFPDNATVSNDGVDIFLTNVLMDGCTTTNGGFNSVYQINATGFHIKNSLWLNNGNGRFPLGNACIISGGTKGGYDANIVSDNEFGFMNDPGEEGGDGGADGCAYDFETPTDGVSFVNNFVHNCYGQAMLMMGGAICYNTRVDDNVFFQNLEGTTRHQYELALYGRGTGTIQNNKYQLRNRPQVKDFIAPAGEHGGQGSAGITKSNNEAVDIASQIPATPTCTVSGNTATLSGPAGTVLRYTTDGSVPNESSKIYGGETITVDKTTVINCKAFTSSSYPSITCSRIVIP